MYVHGSRGYGGGGWRVCCAGRPCAQGGRVCFTSTGWMTNGSPDLRHWPSCASMAKSTAASMSTSYAS
eukprot:4105191-Prymnesium_polylepis.1